MHDRLPLTAWLLVLSAIVCVTESSAAGIQIRPIENCSTAFAGEEIRIGFRIISDRTLDGSLQWSHSAEQRTLARGNSGVRRSSEISGVAECVLRLPELRDGVIFHTTLNVEFIPQGSTTAAASLQHALWLFPRNPLAGKSEWARQLDVELLDPTGDTANILDTLEFPYRQVRSTAPTESTGILLIAEGVSLVKARRLATGALEAAAAGRRVVLLSPTDGKLPIPGIAGEDILAGSVGELRFARNRVITQLDKRLDARAWSGSDNRVPSRGLLIENRRGRIETAISEEPQAWPWLEIHFPETQGILVVCGFTVIEHWEHGPTPRFLLIRLLESLERK